MIIFGIDPGKTGAVATFNTKTCECLVIQLPMVDKQMKNKKARKRSFIDISALRTFIQIFPSNSIAYIEDVASSPQMGVVSAFTFGENFGTLKGIFGGLNINTKLVRPQLWKSILKLPADKKKTVAKMCKIFDNGSTVFYGPRGGIKDGLAEASGLAIYGALDLGKQFKTLPTVKTYII